MTTEDILALHNLCYRPRRRGVQRRRSALGVIVAAGLMVLAVAATYAAQQAQALVPPIAKSDLGAVVKAERSGVVGLPIRF